jgi:uncharacterized protein (DUF2252 family)
VKKKKDYPAPDGRSPFLDRTRKLKMADSSHRFVRGSTVKFYEWLGDNHGHAIPDGPPIWICGDCHVGNLGPIANSSGRVEIQIRDLDQTVVGNPAHDLLRLALSLASSARGSDLPGVTTALMLESIMEGYEAAFEPTFDPEADLDTPPSVLSCLRQSVRASWRTLAKNRIDDPSPEIPIGQKFWPSAEKEHAALEEACRSSDIHRLATMLRSRPDDADVTLVDAAYWLKGCSSLGKLRFAAILEIKAKDNKKRKRSHCLMDFKEAVQPVAPPAKNAHMPENNAERVVEGARQLSPHLGRRMASTSLLHKSVFVRELMPQDLKLELDAFSATEAESIAYYLAAVVGRAHSRQLDTAARQSWLAELKKDRTRSLDAPNWLWRAVVDLLAEHERAYLEHCRRYALELSQAS